MPSPLPSPPVPRRIWSLSLIALVLCSAVLMPLVVVGSLVFMSHQQDATARLGDVRRADTTLALSRQNFIANLVDYTTWDEAYRRMVVQLDPAWFDDSMGPGTYGTALHHDIVLVDAAGRPLRGAMSGRVRAWSPDARYGAGFQRLLDEVVRSALPSFAVASYQWREGHLELLAVAKVQPKDPALLTPGRPARYLVMVRRLDAAVFATLARGVDLQGLRAISPIPAPELSTPVRDDLGHTVARLTWQAQSPGPAVLAQVLPLVGLLLLGGMAAVGFTVRSVARSARSLARSEASANQLAHHDSLTGLPNRRAFFNELSATLKAPLPRCAIFYLDLDGFKEVNDVFGHDAGDLLLLEVSERIRASLPADLALARLGGDEFAVLARGAYTADELLRLAGRICERTLRPFVVSHVELQIGCSVGVAIASPGTSAAELLRQADVAMYAAKDDGKGRARLFRPAMDDGQRAAKTLEGDLRAAVQSDQIRLVYQPIVDATTRRLVSAEVLCRWEHPTQGAISPAVFIPVAESSGLIVALGERILREACRQAVRWPDLKLSVNLSPVQFRSVNLLQSIQQVLVDTGFPANRLELEITEGYLMAQPETAARLIRQLRALGVGISLDDFGTGYASIGFLRRFELDRIKLDRSYVSDIAERPQCAEVARAMVALARTLALPVTAEGVETPQQAEALAQIGCARLQGWLYGRGVDGLSFERQWMQGRNRPLPSPSYGSDNVFTLPLASST